jgi:hypothetical protein
VTTLEDGLATRSTPAWAEKLVRALDDGIRIPGTRIRFGLDPLIGFFLPAVGDAATGVASVALLALAWRRRVPVVTMLRMVLNIAIDALVGSVPVAGDLFDLFWRSNRKNLELVERHQGEARPEPSTGDYLIVSAAFIAAVAALLTPILVTLVNGAMLLRVLRG